MDKKILKVEGMSCEHCVKAVTDAVSALPGLAEVRVVLKEGTVSFNYDASVTPLEVIKSAIVDAGFETAG